MLRSAHRYRIGALLILLVLLGSFTAQAQASLTEFAVGQVGRTCSVSVATDKFALLGPVSALQVSYWDEEDPSRITRLSTPTRLVLPVGIYTFVSEALYVGGAQRLETNRIACALIDVEFLRTCDGSGSALLRYTLTSIPANPILSTRVRLIPEVSSQPSRVISTQTGLNVTAAAYEVNINSLDAGSRSLVVVSAQTQFGRLESNSFPASLVCPRTASEPTPLPTATPTPDTPTPTPVPNPVSEPVLACPAGTQQFDLIPDPLTLTVSDAPQDRALNLTADSPNGFLQVITMVGHPEAGCPASGGELCFQQQDNEEVNVFIDGSPVAQVPDHGENRWQVFEYPLALTTGNYSITFAHSGRIGNNPFGSVGIKAAYCAGGDAFSASVAAAALESPAPLPEPPPAKLCVDMNFEPNGVVRAVSETDRFFVNCRLLVENGEYRTWLGGPLTSPEQVGVQSVIDMGIMQAVDVFSPAGERSFVGDVAVCLLGSGRLIYLNANLAPRVPQEITAWTTPSFPGFTCGTLYEPGTLVLVEDV